MAKILERQTAIYLYPESSYGKRDETAPPIPLTVFNVKISPNTDTYKREPYRASLSPVAEIVTKVFTELEFEVELGGIDAFPLQILLSAVGIKGQTGQLTFVTENIDATNTDTITLSHLPIDATELVLTSDGRPIQVPYKVIPEEKKIVFQTPVNDSLTVKYYTPEQVNGAPQETLTLFTPTSQEFGSVSFDVYLGQLKWTINGARGNVEIIANANETAKLRFKFRGLYVNPTTEPPPQMGCGDDVTPPLVRGVDFAFNRGYYPTLSKWSLDMNNDLVARDDMNLASGVGGVEITSRKPQGSLDPDLMLPEEFDIFNATINASEVDMRFHIGDFWKQGARAVLINVPHAVFSSLDFGERNGVRTADLKFTAVGCDNELRIAVK